MNRKDKLKLLIADGKKLINNPIGIDNPEFSSWNASVIRFMEREFGIDNTDTIRLKNRDYSPSVLAIGADNSETIYRKYKSDLEKTIYELESIYEDYEDMISDNDIVQNETKFNKNIPNIILNIETKNLNSNVNNIDITFENVIENMNKDENLSDDNKKEIKDIINEINAIGNNKDLSKKDKWQKIKMLLSFLLDKGIDFVIAYLPQIILLIGKVVK